MTQALPLPPSQLQPHHPPSGLHPHRVMHGRWDVGVLSGLAPLGYTRCDVKLHRTPDSQAPFGRWMELRQENCIRITVGESRLETEPSRLIL